MTFCVRWPNGDFSIVDARSKEAAAVMLDEWGPVEPRDIHRLPGMMVDFRLTEDGDLELVEFSELTMEKLQHYYPLVDQVFKEFDPGDPEFEQAMAAAVKRERDDGGFTTDPVEGEHNRIVQEMADASSAYMRAVTRTAKGREGAGE